MRRIWGRYSLAATLNSSTLCARDSIARTLRSAAIAIIALGLAGSSIALAGENSSDGDSGPSLFIKGTKPQASAVTKSGFVPRWVPVERTSASAETTEESHVEQAFAVSLSNDHTLPIGDPRLPEPMPELTSSAPVDSETPPKPKPTPISQPESSPKPAPVSPPASIPTLSPTKKPTAELEPILPGEESSTKDAIMPVDEFDGFMPEMSNETPMFGEPMDAAIGGCYRPGGCRPISGPPGCDSLFNRLWVRSNTLLWWIQGFEVPALVTTSSNSAPTPFTDGALGQFDTSVLLGDQRIDNPLYTGVRIEFGYWFDPCETVGVGASFFGLGREDTTYRYSSTGSSVLARPFYDVQSASQSAWPVAMDEYTSGSVLVEASTEMLGTEVYFRRAVVQTCDSRVDFMIGYRFARLADTLRISQSSTATNSSNLLDIGSTMDLYDDFATKNLFNGAEIGITSKVRRCRWTVETSLKLAFGATHSSVDISGGTISSLGTSSTGLLAQPSNIGRHEHQSFTMLPELGVNIGYDITCNLKFNVGYSLLYWSKVARPGGQIDTNLDLARSGTGEFPAIPPAAADGAQLPRFNMGTTDVWAQGLNLGLSYRY